MPRWGMVIDLDKCTACQACTVACLAENNVPFAGPEETGLGRAILWHEVIGRIEGEYPNLRATFIPRPCMHCDNPPCVKVCPVGATYRREDGLVMQDYDQCIGCRMCIAACPYEVRYFNWRDPQWPEPMDRYRNPDQGPPQPTGGRGGPDVRPRGVVEKCTFCVHRLEKAKRKAQKEHRELTEQEVTLLPACNQTCPASARYFGDLDNPKSTVSQLARSARAFSLLEDLGTEPKVIYLKEGR
ncbi:MAG: 4Fe-4S dicluster domain-containing protein [Anaerolineales bacterium]|nr:MAG: 4Fe-4S dicluster domain-containing protein [Anaerolineales bacterium]